MALEPISIVSPTHITPIPCPYCKGNAHLVRRTPTMDLQGEVRGFACADCGKEIETTVRD